MRIRGPGWVAALPGALFLTLDALHRQCATRQVDTFMVVFGTVSIPTNLKFKATSGCFVPYR